MRRGEIWWGSLPEPTGALGAAGLFHRSRVQLGDRVGVVISGGNADLKALAGLV